MNPYENIRLPFVRAKLATRFQPDTQLIANEASCQLARLSLNPNDAALRRAFAQNFAIIEPEMRGAK